MKNIHILPTKKSSSLYREDDGTFGYDFVLKSYGGIDHYNMYITSDEEIKKDDWCLDTVNEILFISDGRLDLHKDTDKKIVKTSDTNLIIYGIDPIGDSFLEWHVNHSSIEYVEIKKILQTRWGTEWHDLPNQIEGREPEGIYRNIYRIILPKEENHFLERGITIIDLSRQKLDGHHPDYTALLKPVGDEEDNYQDSLGCSKMEYEAFRNLNKETITKGAAEHWVFKINGGKWSNNDDTAGDNYASFMAGAKWQEEKSYNEDQLREAYFQGWVTRERFDDLSPDIIYPKGLDYEEKQEYAFNLWFKQLKK